MVGQWGLSSKIPLCKKQMKGDNCTYKVPESEGTGRGPCLTSQFVGSEDIEQALSWEPQAGRRPGLDGQV